MFEELDDAEMEKLKHRWSNDRPTTSLPGLGWHEATIGEVRSGLHRGRPRVQVIFVVDGKRLVKDFWLTERGVHVFRGFLRQLQLAVDDILELDEEMLLGRKCLVGISEKIWDTRRWLEINSVRTDASQIADADGLE